MDLRAVIIVANEAIKFVIGICAVPPEPENIPAFNLPIRVITSHIAAMTPTMIPNVVAALSNLL